MRVLAVLGVALFSGREVLGGPSFSFISKRAPEAVFIQENRGSRWFSPEGLSSDFPRISSHDCARYGTGFGYPECGPTQTKPRAAPEPVAVATSLQGKPETPNALSRKTLASIKSARPGKLRNENGSGAADNQNIAEMPSVKAVIGHLLLARFQGLTPKDQGVIQIVKALRDKRVAGVIFQSGNIRTPSQMKDLALSFERQDAGGLPPLLAVDQPGGSDSTLAEEKGFAVYAAPNLVARQQSPYEAQVVYGDMAVELTGLGLNLNIGPSADPCLDRDTMITARCFSTQPSNVAAFLAAFNFAHHDKGMLTASRSLPKTTPDANSLVAEMPGVVIMRELAKRQPADALVVPIQPSSAFDRMSVVVRIDLTKPGTEVAMRSAGFEGVIIAEMQTVGSGVPFRTDEVAVKAIESGADMIILPEPGLGGSNSLNWVTGAIETAVAAGRISLARLQESAQRVDQMRSRLQPARKSVQVAKGGELINASAQP